MPGTPGHGLTGLIVKLVKLLVSCITKCYPSCYPLGCSTPPYRPPPVDSSLATNLKSVIDRLLKEWEWCGGLPAPWGSNSGDGCFLWLMISLTHSCSFLHVPCKNFEGCSVGGDGWSPRRANRDTVRWVQDIAACVVDNEEKCYDIQKQDRNQTHTAEYSSHVTQCTQTHIQIIHARPPHTHPRAHARAHHESLQARRWSVCFSMTALT